MITDADMRQQVNLTLSDLLCNYDVEAIVGEIKDAYGLIDIDEVPSEHYWAIVARHVMG